MHWEPGGYDFLSPCLQEADIMRKVLPQKEFAVWLKDFCLSSQILISTRTRNR